jgi:L-fuconolactonase
MAGTALWEDHGAVTDDSEELVDAHQHVWDLTVRDQPWLRQAGLPALLRDFGVADLLPLARAAGVTATVVVQTVIDRAETPELMALAAEGGLVAGAVGWVDLEDPGVHDTLAALQARPDGHYLRGIRHPVLAEDDVDWLRRQDVWRGLAAVAAAGLCYDLVVAPSQLPAAVDAARAQPGLTFVLDHLGNPDIGHDGPRPDARWVRAITDLAALPNVVCKLSGILGEPSPSGQAAGDATAAAATPVTATPVTAPPVTAPAATAGEAPVPDVAHLVPCYDLALSLFGPGRLMFGSDWPVCTVSAPYHAVVAAARALTAALTPSERRQIFSGTARRVYGL